jgi:hypothetical protein
VNACTLVKWSVFIEYMSAENATTALQSALDRWTMAINIVLQNF